MKEGEREEREQARKDPGGRRWATKRSGETAPRWREGNEEGRMLGDGEDGGRMEAAAGGFLPLNVKVKVPDILGLGNRR